ncbi:MAG: HEAT repeat domain-containing protein [Planctomycetes bacterium]|nr:HEAT repeat domain-containing protein [Planctomycetota bacterium]
MIALLALLALLPQDEAVRKLIEQLSADNIEARAEAYRKLEAIGRPALPLLEKAALDPDGEVSSRAKTLLVRIPIREHLTPALVDHVRGIYERLAQGEWKQVFLEIATDLRLPDDRRRYSGVRPEDLSFMAPMALQRAETDTDKMSVCEAIGRCGLKSAMPEVVRLLSSEQYMVRANAAAAIRDAGAREKAGEIRKLVADPHPVVRSVAAHTLGRLGAKDAVPDLVTLLRDASPDVEWWAVRSLGELGAKEAVGDIERLASDPNETVRRVAAETAAALLKVP